MSASAVPTISEVRVRHDAFISRVLKERNGEGADPVSISPLLADEIAIFVTELHEIGKALYDHEERGAALSLMGYWINALYRAQYYQRRSEEPPPPVIAPFAPESQPALRDEDYPWPLSDRPEKAVEWSSLWRRLSIQGVRILKSRRALGVTGASGCGRSNLIDTGITPEFCQDAGGDIPQHLLSPAEGFDEDAVKPAKAGDEDLPFLSSLVAVANSVSSSERPLEIAELAHDPAALARRLDATGKPHLVIVHDLHQLFVLADDSFDLEPSAGQRAFLAALTCVATSPAGHYLMVDVQTEYLARLRSFPEFQQLFDRPDENAMDGWLIVSLENDELRAFLTKPAEKIGLNFEAGLVDRIVFEHQSEAAAATILLFTLRRLWLEMIACQDEPGGRRNMITWTIYRRVGSGRLVLEIAADEATKKVLDAEGSDGEKDRSLEAIRLVFLELVRIMPGSAWWLPKVPVETIRARLTAAGHPADRVARILGEFKNVGLFVETTSMLGKKEVRIFHDTLVSRWTRLIQWLEVERNAKRLRWMLRSDAREWSHLLPHTAPVEKTRPYARVQSEVSRFDRRMSLLWRGAKLREAGKFPHLSTREQRFLSESKKLWYVTLAVWILAIAALPVALITLIFLHDRHQQTVLTTQYMNRGVSLIARGDPSLESGLWLAASHEVTGKSLEGWILGRLPQFLRPGFLSANELPHLMSTGMAFRRMPTLRNLVTVPDGMVAMDISPSGRYAILGCRKQGSVPGRVLLWDLQGGTKELVSPSQDVSIERVAFARRPGSPADQDTLMVAAGSSGNVDVGVVYVWDLRNPLLPASRLPGLRRVRDVAFLPQSVDASPQYLAIADGDETKVPARGGGYLCAITPGKDGPAIQPPQWLNDQRDTSSIYSLPATHLAFSREGHLAVSYLDASTGTGRMAIFRKGESQDWKGMEIAGGTSLLPIADLAFSNDSHEVLAIGTGKADQSEGRVRLFRPDKAGWAEAGSPLQLRAGILRVAFHPMGGALLATAANGVVGIWSVDDNGVAKPTREIREEGWPFSVAWSPDGRWIAVGNRDRHARIWDAATGRPVLPPLYNGGTVASIGFTPDGLNLLATTVKTARLWSAAPRDFSLLPVRAVGRAYQTILSGDGHSVVVAATESGQSRDGVPHTEVAVWRDDGLVPAKRYLQLPFLSRLAVSADATYVAALPAKQSAEGNIAFVWDTKSGKNSKIPVNEGADFLGIVSGPKPRLLVAGAIPSAKMGTDGKQSKVGFVQVFDLQQPDPQSQPVGIEFRVKAFASSPDGQRVVIGGDGGASLRGGSIAAVDLSEAVPRIGARLNEHAEPVVTLALSKDGTKLLSGSVDDTVMLMAVDSKGGISIRDRQKAMDEEQKPAKGEERKSDDRRHTADVTSVSFSHDGTRAVSTGLDSAAILYDVSDFHLKPLVAMEHRGMVTQQTFSPDDQWLATGGDDGVSLWYAGGKSAVWQGKRVAAMPHRYPVTGLAFTAEGQLCSLAMERSPTDASSSQVESYRWTIQPEQEAFAKTKGLAELLAGRRLEGVPPAPVRLKAWELKERLPSSAAGNTTDAKAALGADIRNQALSAATSGDWKAAGVHLRALRNQDPEKFDGDVGTLMFAAETFESAGDPVRVLAATEVLLPKLATPEDRRLYREKHGLACLKLARDPDAKGRAGYLEKAENDFKTLAGDERDKWWWLVRQAEVFVLREDWENALRCLTDSKREFAVTTDAPNELGRDVSSGSQDQRIAAIYLLQAARSWKTDPALAAKQEGEWRTLVHGTLEQHREAKPTAKVRAAWPAVLGDKADPQDVGISVAYAQEGCRERPDSFARANTLAMAYLRAGQLDEAEKTLNESISLYERERQKSEGTPSSDGQGRLGRPADWILRSLLLIARGERETDGVKKQEYLRQAEVDLASARMALNRSLTQPLTEWRATWNTLDLRVLVGEAERKLKKGAE